MDITFDSSKDAANLHKHGVSLSLAEGFEWDDAIIRRDPRHYDEVRLVLPATSASACLFWSMWTTTIPFTSSASVPPNPPRYATMPKLKPGTIIPDAAEDARIQAGIDADPDTVALNSEWFASARPAREFLSPERYAALTAPKKASGRPKLESPKVPIALRLDAETLSRWKASGPGYQTRMGEWLAKWQA